jgi:hypothetical protein
MLTTREATPADAATVASILDVDRRAAERLCRDRAVRIAVESGGDEPAEPRSDRTRTGSGNERDEGTDGDPDPDPDPNARAVLAYEVRSDAVHVARLAGSNRGVEALLAEPERFADAEGLPVEAVTPAADEDTRSALATAGFEEVGEGPRFEGDRTVRYRLRRD